MAAPGTIMHVLEVAAAVKTAADAHAATIDEAAAAAPDGSILTTSAPPPP